MHILQSWVDAETLRSLLATSPYHLTPRLSHEGRSGRRRACGCQSVRTAFDVGSIGLSAFRTPAVPATRYVIQRRLGDDDGLSECRRLSPRPTLWSRARRSSPSGRMRRRWHRGDVIDATGRIVMPGFIDTHHHQFETALRSYLADGVLINDGSGTPSGSIDLLRVHPEQIRARCTGRRTSTSMSCSAGSASSTTASPRCTTSRRSSHTPAALGRRHSGADRYRAPRRLRLFRERG